MTKKLVSLALIAVTLAMFIPAVSTAANEWTMYVYTDNGKGLNVRKEPKMGDNIVYSLPYGSEVTVLGISANGWATIEEIVAGERYISYVQSRFLVSYKPAPKSSGKSATPTAAPASKTSDLTKAFSAMNSEFASGKKVSPYTVVSRPSRASGWVNLRWAPTTEAERIATCPQGKELTVLAELRNWYQVQDPATGMIGFISRQYVTRK